MNLKTLSLATIIIVLGGFLTYLYNPSYPAFASNQPVPCQEPLTYRLGAIDNRYNISHEQLADIMTEVETIWATALDKDLLDYRKDGRVAINLVYSEDQERTDEERRFSKRIELKGDLITVVRRQYEQLKNRFEEKRAKFRKRLADYNRSAKSHNRQLKEWDDKRSVPASVRERLQQEERALQQKKAEINRMQQNLELLRKQTNTRSRELNKLIEQQNEMIAEYNNQFGTVRKFDQGRYIKQGSHENINIYQFGNHAQLKTVLTHEAGHALGLGHVDNPESVMYKLMEEQNIFDLHLTEEDISAIKNRCAN